MVDSEFDESLVCLSASGGGDRDTGYGYIENLYYNNLMLIDYEDESYDFSNLKMLDFKWVEGNRKFTIGNPNAGFDTTKVYDVWELYNEKKNSKK